MAVQDPPFNLVAALEDYHTRFPNESGTVDLFLGFIRSTPDHFLREHLEGHLTGSAFVIDEDCTETLLVHHRKLNLWVQPGGHADGNPDLRDVSRQELQEETGLEQFTCDARIFDLDRHTIPARHDVPEHYHWDVRFLFRAKRDQPVVVSHESIDVRWFSLSTLAKVDTDTSVRRMARKALELKHP